MGTRPTQRESKLPDEIENRSWLSYTGLTNISPARAALSGCVLQLDAGQYFCMSGGPVRVGKFIEALKKGLAEAGKSSNEYVTKIDVESFIKQVGKSSLPNSSCLIYLIDETILKKHPILASVLDDVRKENPMSSYLKLRADPNDVPTHAAEGSASSYSPVEKDNSRENTLRGSEFFDDIMKKTEARRASRRSSHENSPRDSLENSPRSSKGDASDSDDSELGNMPNKH